LAHRAAAAGAGRNLLVPKPKPTGDIQRPGQRQRKPAPARPQKMWDATRKKRAG
jgi:hypothetical protein